MAGQDRTNDRGASAPAAPAADDACRCKETADMSPRELLRRMMDDLAFWKKGRQEAPGAAPHKDREPGKGS